jgi:hypothetical protein
VYHVTRLNFAAAAAEVYVTWRAIASNKDYHRAPETSLSRQSNYRSQSLRIGESPL